MPDGGASPPDGREIDAPPPDANVPDAPPPDANVPEAPPDANVPDAPPPGPRIDTVATADGSHQIRQGDTVELVITGADLAQASAASLGPLPIAIVSASDATLRGTVTVPHGFAAQSLGLQVTTPQGTTLVANAMATTFHVIVPDAAPGGRGTNESPISLCDPLIATAARGDTLALAAGTHRCATTVGLVSGMHVVGAGVATTLLEDFGGFRVGSVTDIEDVTTLAGLTARAATGTMVRVDEGTGGLSIDGFAVEGGARGIASTDLRTPRGPSAVAIANFRYQATGVAVTLQTDATIRDSTIEGCTTGVDVLDGHVVLQRVAITGCTTAVQVQPPSAIDAPATLLSISDSQLIKNQTGLQIDGGTTTLDRVSVLDTAPAPGSWFATLRPLRRSLARPPRAAASTTCATGVLIRNGSVAIRAQSKIGCTQFAVHADSLGVILPPGVDARQSVSIEDAQLVEADTGIAMDGARDPSPLSVRRSQVAGRVAAVSIRSNQTVCDLGTTAQPGGNALTSPGVAYRDRRGDPEGGFETCNAVGTTLNGTSYAGQLITGPAALGSDYQLDNAGVAIQF